MILGIYAVYDSGVGAWMSPMYMRNRGEATRWWQEVCNNPESRLNKHPSDYTLFELGTYNDLDASFDLMCSPSKVGVALEFIANSDRGLGVSPVGENLASPIV